MHQPGPLHAYYERLRARRGHGKAIVAAARKLAVLFWCLLTREENYAHQQPSLTANKLRRLELTAGADKYSRQSQDLDHQPDDARRRTAARRAGRSVLHADGPRLASQPAGSNEGGRERDTGARITLDLEGHVARQTTSP